MALQTVCSDRLVYRLDSLVHGDSHVCSVRNKNTSRLYPFILHLVADEAINVFKLGFRSCWFRDGTKACMAIPATGPVAENVYSVTVECCVKLALDARSICYILSMPLPLVVIRSMKISRLGIMTLETHC